MIYCSVHKGASTVVHAIYGFLCRMSNDSVSCLFCFSANHRNVDVDAKRCWCHNFLEEIMCYLKKMQGSQYFCQQQYAPVAMFSFYFFSQNSHFSCFGSGHCSTFWEECHNGFYWSLTSGALPRAEETMLSASLNRCCDSRAFHKRRKRRSIFPKNRASISISWRDKGRTSFEFITVMTVLTTHLEASVFSSHIMYSRCRGNKNRQIV